MAIPQFANTQKCLKFEEVFSEAQETFDESLFFMQRMAFIAASEILYTRQLLDPSDFITRKFGETIFHALNPKTENGCAIAFRLKSPVEAIGKANVKRFSIIIGGDSEDGLDVCVDEIYTMHFAYGINGHIRIARQSTQRTEWTLEYTGSDSVQKQTAKLMRLLSELKKTLLPVPYSAMFCFRVTLLKDHDLPCFKKDTSNLLLAKTAVYKCLGGIATGEAGACTFIQGGSSSKFAYDMFRRGPERRVGDEFMIVFAWLLIDVHSAYFDLEALSRPQTPMRLMSRASTGQFHTEQDMSDQSRLIDAGMGGSTGERVTMGLPSGDSHFRVTSTDQTNGPTIDMYAADHGFGDVSTPQKAVNLNSGVRSDIDLFDSTDDDYLENVRDVSGFLILDPPAGKEPKRKEKERRGDQSDLAPKGDIVLSGHRSSSESSGSLAERLRKSWASLSVESKEKESRTSRRMESSLQVEPPRSSTDKTPARPMKPGQELRQPRPRIHLHGQPVIVVESETEAEKRKEKKSSVVRSEKNSNEVRRGEVEQPRQSDSAAVTASSKAHKTNADRQDDYDLDDGTLLNVESLQDDYDETVKSSGAATIASSSAREAKEIRRSRSADSGSLHVNVDPLSRRAPAQPMARGTEIRQPRQRVRIGGRPVISVADEKDKDELETRESVVAEEVPRTQRQTSSGPGARTGTEDLGEKPAKPPRTKEGPSQAQTSRSPKSVENGERENENERSKDSETNSSGSGSTRSRRKREKRNDGDGEKEEVQIVKEVTKRRQIQKLLTTMKKRKLSQESKEGTVKREIVEERDVLLDDTVLSDGNEGLEGTETAVSTRVAGQGDLPPSMKRDVVDQEGVAAVAVPGSIPRRAARTEAIRDPQAIFGNDGNRMDREDGDRGRQQRARAETPATNTDSFTGGITDDHQDSHLLESVFSTPRSRRQTPPPEQEQDEEPAVRKRFVRTGRIDRA